MPRISQLSVVEFQERVNRFSQKYVEHWDSWLSVSPDDKSNKFGEILRSWQACRPNKMRRTRNYCLQHHLHGTPFLDDLIHDANRHIETIEQIGFDMRNPHFFENRDIETALTNLWNIFVNLSYEGQARNGLSGVVGISKSIMLLTNGRVGPAFDSQVRDFLDIVEPNSPKQWIEKLNLVSKDILAFEKKHKLTFIQATPPKFQNLHSGRIYDMALGPS